MSQSQSRNYPPGVPDRSRRPRGSGSQPELAALGALAGLALSENVGGALLGAFIGAAVAPEGAALPLKEALAVALKKQGATLINFYRRGPYSAEVLFKYGEGYWTIRSHAPRVTGWVQEDLDDWLYGDLLEHQLPDKLARIAHGGRR